MSQPDPSDPTPAPAHRTDLELQLAAHEHGQMFTQKLTEADLDARQAERADWPWQPTSVEQDYRLPMRSEYRRSHEPSCLGIDGPPSVIQTTLPSRWWASFERLWSRAWFGRGV